METTKDISKIENAELIFDPKNITKETIKKYLCPLASDQELMLGLQIAKTFNLNPLKREVYFVKYKAREGKPEKPMQVLTGYEVYLKRAERSGKYNGLEITSQGKVSDGSLKAIVKVFRKDWTNPLVHEVYYNEYVQMKIDSTSGKEAPNTFWATKPITMIKKVAVSQAFRMAFPDEFDGMPYTSDEVVDQENIGEANDQKEDISPEEAIKLKSEAFLDKKDFDELTKSMTKLGFKPQDLKEFIFFTFELDKFSKIQYKHMPAIQQAFSKPKVNQEVQELFEKA